MIDVPMGHNNGIDFPRQMRHRLINAMQIRLHRQTQNHTRKINARKIGIHKQRVSSRFKLKSIRSEISHAHLTARRRGRRNVSSDQM